MQISVPVTFDATNQTMSVSDSSLITFPQNTSDFSIVTVNGMDCITPTTVSTARANYVTFGLANVVTEIEFDSYITIPTASWNWNLWFELVVPGPTYYSLTYEPQGNWHNPDGLSCDLATGTWYTVKVTSSTVNIYNKSSGTLVHTRSLVGMPNNLSIANFIGSTSYLTNLVLKKVINTEAIRYANTSGIAEIWANIKNWVSAHIGNGTLTIQKNGTDVTTFNANSSSNATANITVPTKVSDLTNDSGFLTTANIPSKTSDLVNDSGFLTSHQSLSNYVTIDTAQDIEGNKNFKGLLTTIPNDTIWPVTASTTDDITYLGANAIHVEQKSSGKLTDLSNGAWSVAELGVGCFFFRINNGTDIRYKHLAQNTVNRIPVVSGANRFINDVTPDENNTYSLGTSSLRWGSCYSNAYYLGTTAFGDIVTHNASEFLTSHQSLSNYVTLNGAQTISGVKTLIDYWHLQAKNLKAGEGETYGRTGYSLVYTDKNDATMGDVTLFKNANAARTFIRIRGGDYYTNGAPAAAGTLVQSALMVGTNVSGKKIIECDSDIVYPTTNNATDLGDSTHQWKSVNAQSYYYNGTQWGLDKANVWTSYQQMVGNPTIWNMKNNSITMGGTQPSSNRYLGMFFYDSADVEMGRMCLQCHKNGSNFYIFSINNSDGTNSYNGSVRMVATRAGEFILYPDAGTWDLGGSSNRWANTYTTNLSVSGTGTCTTPATGDNSTNIATTAFVKAQGYLTAHQSLSGYAALASNNRFTSGQIISGNYMGNESSTNARTCITFQSNRDTNGKSGVFFTKFRQNVAQGSMGSGDLVRLSLDILENEVRSNDSFMFRWSGFNSDVATAISFCPSSVPTTRWLGTSSNRWTTIYGVDGNFSGTITGSITGTAKGLATSEPMTNETLTYNEGQLTIGSAAGNAYSGSSGTFSLISFPANGTLASNGVANIQNIRLPWATDAKYWHDIFVSPNNNYVWHRDVRKGTGNGWRRLVEENVSGLTNQTWDISIGGTSANVTGTVAIANGGTGATTRLNAVKNLTSEDVGTSTQFFLTITQNWGKAGYCSVANAKTVLGIPNTQIGSRNTTGTWTISCAVNTLTYIYIFGTLTSDGGSVSVKSGGIVLTSIRSSPSYKVCGGSNTRIWEHSGEWSSGTATLIVHTIVATTAASLKLSISGITGDINILVYQ